MDVLATEAAVKRQRAVSQIRTRVAAAVTSWLSDPECVALSLCATMRGDGEVMESMFTPIVFKGAMAARKAIAVTAEEWNDMFGVAARPTKLGLIDKTATEETFVRHLARLQSALRCTIVETGQSTAWSKEWTKAACLVAMHSFAHEEGVAACLGNVVRSDLRRLEDLVAAIDEEGVEEMLMGQVVLALSDSVT